MTPSSLTTSPAGVKRRKLCYILQEYDEDTPKHFFHIYELLHHLRDSLEIWLIIERSKGRPPSGLGERLFVQRFSASPLRAVEMLLILLRIRAGGVKLFYSHYTFFGGILASLTARLTGGKSFYWRCEMSREFRTKRGLKRAYLHDLLRNDLPLRLTFSLTHRLVTCTRRMADYYAENYGIPREKIRVMPNWVNLQRFDATREGEREAREELGLPPEARVILFAHRLAPRKGADYLTEICGSVSERVKDSILLIAGDGPERGRIGREAAERGVQNRMRMLGDVPNRKMPKLYAAADLFIMPSRQEAFGRVLLEAMAMRVPFVATECEGVKELCTPLQKRYVVPVGDIASFSDKVVELLNNPSAMAALREEGLRRVRDFTGERVAQIFMENLSS